MKAVTLFRAALGLLSITFFAFCLTVPPRLAQAQGDDYLDPSEKYSRAELAQMLAPIALYPDALLAQILMASTYPIEVVEADRWVSRHPELKDDVLDAALLDKNWDPSVKAICHFPSILSLLSERIAETTNLGNAFLAQEAEVMDVVQELRARARAEGHLASTEHQKVIVERETVIIEPVNPRVIYVPYYDPFYVYGAWWYPGYPPFYWGPPGVHIGIGISYWPGFYFGFVFGAWSYFDWHHHHIYIDAHRRPRFVRERHWVAAPGHWHHDPRHRQGVAYRDKFTARKYYQSPSRPRVIRRDIRGYPEVRELERERRGDTQTRIGRTERSETQTSPRTNREIRHRLEREKAPSIRTEPDRQLQERSIGKQQQRPEIKPEVRRLQQAPGNRQLRQRPAVAQQKRAQSNQQQRRRNTVFGDIEDGERARRSSERGRGSRQGLDFGFGSRGRSGGDTRGSRLRR